MFSEPMMKTSLSSWTTEPFGQDIFFNVLQFSSPEGLCCPLLAKP